MLKWILIAASVAVFITAMVIGVDALKCTPPCVQEVVKLDKNDLEYTYARSMMYWRWTALIIYLLICFYDFLFVPIWYGLNRPDISQFMDIINATSEPLVQMELMKKLTGQHNPFTLMGGGLFHLAFGAILTGSAVGMRK